VPKVHTKPIKRPSIGFNKRAKRQPKAPLVWRTGLSGGPPDMSGAPEDSKLKLVTFGKIQRQLHYNSPDCPVYTGHVRCSKEERPQELASLGISSRLFRYNSPDMSGVHQTVRCNSGATTTSGANGYLQRIYCAPARAEVRHAHAGAPDTLQYMSGAPPDIQAGPEVRAPTVGTQRLW
jgi:hypothetical protein